MMFAAYASTPENSRGRRIAEEAPDYRTEYQRDRDRIVHSAAFRRLEYKTQVFVNHEGDMFRTRLTHSIEVAQIARSIARALHLNEDLSEAIALAHDLGHTPFGHAGQDALNECMREYGGFEHNLQSLRIVDMLEERYAEFPGLNLTFETREGILKHCSRQNAKTLGELGERFLQRQQPSLEAQLTNLADEIAYNNHDIDDGLRSGLIDINSLQQTELFGEQYSLVCRQYPGLPERRTIHEVVRRMINQQVTDLINTSQEQLRIVGPTSLDDVRNHGAPLIGFSASMHKKNRQLKQYLRQNLYTHFKVLRMSNKAGMIIRELFHAFFEQPGLLPHEPQDRIASSGGSKDETARIVADYISGMTDRYAMAEHKRLFLHNH
ncbi:MAG: deoxyguanosinetriphosphate triphosphohydrolase [Gammaproteobacteria bacterium]|nr:MAG: deoxyguanosinetriphosphate triphosphohydrolase [Gammaproteobacteria bacterium]